MITLLKDRKIKLLIKDSFSYGAYIDEQIKKYLPEGLTDKILSQRNKIEGERKQVTVMFCDMAGFTSLVEKLGPEKGYSIMDTLFY